MEFHEELRKARIAAHLTQQQVANAMGITKSTYCGYETAKRQPDPFKIKQMANILKVSTDTLLSMDHLEKSSMSREAEIFAKDYDALDDHGKRVLRMVADEEKARIEAESKMRTTQLVSAAESDPETEDNIVRFPFLLYRQASSAGFGDWADSEYAEQVELVKQPPLGASFIIPVNGDSMEPTYPDGCRVFVRSQHEIREGQVGIFYMDGKSWIKELGSDALISHNPDYPPQPFQEDLRCWGLVVGICDDSYFEH